MLPHWTENDVLVDGNRIHYYRTGAGDKPPMVLAHGFSDSGLCWLAVAQELEADYDIILPDARGHGLSQRLQPGEWIDQPGDLAGVITGLGLQQAIVGGHSMGGSTTGAFGARFPELAKALILEDPAWLTPKEPTSPNPHKRGESEYDRWLMQTHTLSIEEIDARGRANDPSWPEIERYPWALAKQQFDPNFLTAERQWKDWREDAAKLQCPVLLITANNEKGAIVTAEGAEVAVSLNPRIQVVNMPEAGHNIRRESFSEYVAAVRAFLKSLA